MIAVKLTRDYYPPQHRSGGVRVMSGYVWTDGVYNVEIKKMEKIFRVRVGKIFQTIVDKKLLDENLPSVKKCRQAIVDTLNKDCGEARYK